MLSNYECSERNGRPAKLGRSAICFCSIKLPVSFAWRRLAPTFGKRLWLLRVIIARKLAPEHSIFCTLRPHLFSSQTSSIRLTNASANLLGRRGCGFFQHERGSTVGPNTGGIFWLETFRPDIVVENSAESLRVDVDSQRPPEQRGADPLCKE